MAERATLKLEDMAHGGDAVGFWQGQAVFVALGAPGDTVVVELHEGGPRFLRGQLLEVLSPSPQRVAPPCPYFGRCGGCHWQHLSYEAQLGWKERIVGSLLERIGKQSTPPVQTIIGMEEPWNYRNHVQLQADRAGQLGFYALNSHAVVPVETCIITHPLVDEIWGALDVELPGLRRIALRAGIHTGDQMAVFEGRGALPPALELDLPISCLYLSDRGEVTVLAGQSTYREQLFDRVLRVSGPSFFQNNTVQTECLIEVVGELLALRSGETLLDAYCGVGTLALALAKPGVRLVGIEGSPWAVADARANAAEAGVEMSLHEGAVEEVLPSLATPYQVAILDPPRGGCAPEALRALAQARPERIVYVSCDPATLARDVATLVRAGYELASVQPIDMFPQTYHIETVALLRRR